MPRHHLRRALRSPGLSVIEENSLVTGLLLIVVAIAFAVVDADAGGAARLLGAAGLVAILVCAGSCGVRGYRAGTPAAIPAAVGRARVRSRPGRLAGAATMALALGLPLAAGVALLVFVPWSWLLVAGVLLLGCCATIVAWTTPGDELYRSSCAAASEQLRRLCMLADMPAPELVVEPGPVAIAWTVRGRIHVTRPTLELLDDVELEAVLAHEVAHLAHRDAAVMDVCSAPSRVLLGFARLVAARLRRWVVESANVHPGVSLWIVVLAVVCVPPAFVIGWLSRLSVLGLSRTREFSADAAAATLTCRPSALASALLKLEHQRAWAPRWDLRRFDADSVLCIVGTGRSALGRLFASHPPTAARVERLAAIEARVQG